jgi:meiotic recombination protein SPO11
MLHLIATPSERNDFKQPPVYALVDYDPDGIDILSTYKHGSAALAHEKVELELPCVQWLGLSSKDLGQNEDLHQSQGLLRLSGRDRRKATRMLEREPFTEDGDEPSWRREIQIMLLLNVKAEIQLLEAQCNGLPGWLKRKGLN